MPADSLSEALALIDARCVLARGIMAGGSWSLALRAYGPLMLVAPARGEFWLSIPRIGRRVHLAEGDVAVVHGDLAQVMSSDPELEPVDGEKLFAGQDQGTLHLGDQPEVA